MGDRANIVIDMQAGFEPDAPMGSIYLYTHWGGAELPATLQSALQRKARWGDESYLARIIFSEMTAGCEKEETGFGISLTPPDNSYPYLRVNSCKKTVTVDYKPVGGGPDVVFTFEEYCAISDISWTALLELQALRK